MKLFQCRKCKTVWNSSWLDDAWMYGEGECPFCHELKAVPIVVTKREKKSLIHIEGDVCA